MDKPMLLAEALAERKALMARTSELDARMRASALIHAGETPTEPVADLRAEDAATVAAPLP